MVRLPTLTRSGLVHGFSTTETGSVGLTHAPDASPVLAARRRFAEELGVDPSAFTVAGAVHGCTVARVDEPVELIPGVDGLVSNRRDVALFATYADCLPVLAFDPEAGAIGLAHAGWRGTNGGVAGALVAAFQAHFGSRPEDLVVGLGPCICGRCYEVGPEFADLFPPAVLAPGGGDRLRLDLREANRRQLAEAGVRRDRMEALEICTLESPQFFSHRRSPDGSRFAAVVALS